MNLVIPFAVYYLSLTLCFWFGIRSYHKLDAGARVLVILTALTMCSEALAMVGAVMFRNNMPVYHFFNPMQLFLIAKYFAKSFDGRRSLLTSYLIGGFGFMIAALNIIWFQPLTNYNSNFLLVEAVIIIAYCLYAYYRLLIGLEHFKITSSPHFWFTTIIFLFWCITFINWGLYDVLKTSLKDKISIVHWTIFSVNICTYCAIAFVFRMYRNNGVKCKTVN